MQERVLKLLGRKDYVPANTPQLVKALKLPTRQAQRLRHRGEVARIKGNRYVIPREADLVPGRIQITRQGRGFLLPDNPGLGEIAIRSADTGVAMHDDRVLVRRDVRPLGMRAKDDPADTGVVVRVLERRRTQIVGTLKKGRQFLRVVPDDPRMVHDILVPPARDVGRTARDGDKVVVELGKWDSPHASPQGTIKEVLGPPTAEGVDMLSVLRQYDLPLKFPRKVLQEVRQFGDEITRRDLKGRKDCRKAPVVTIDPADAKDFDDAFSLEGMDQKRWRLCVHIADVSHYVKPGSALDDEAHERGNSTYLVDRVIPMLPEALSNELCSLKPEVERLTKCVEFLLAADGSVQRTRCYSAVIHSQRRYSYEEAMAVLSGSAEDKLDRMLQDAGRLARKIRKRRFKAGSLELDFPETKIRLDERGRIDRIDFVENDESHHLIEEFMLLANEAVAGRLMKQKRPTLYRVHEPPSPDRLHKYREEVLSRNVVCGNLEKPGEVQKMLRRLEGLSIGPALKIGLLRSLMRARYAIDPLGHYGLAKDKYAHFTSPIRRYADLVVHRTLFEDLDESKASMKEMADHVSATERNSADAERDSKSVKLQAYLLAQLKSGRPERYSALVTDVRNFGFFVDVSDLGMSGLVPLSSLDDDFYEFDAAKVRVRGRRNRRAIKLGDRVEVEIAKVDTEQKRMDFRLAGPPKEKSAKPATSRRRRTGRSGERRTERSSEQGTRKPAARKLSEATKKTKRASNRKAKKPADQAIKRKKGPAKRRKPGTKGKNSS
jgi:ribonuclease R